MTLEEQLNGSSISEEVELRKKFESFVLKRSDLSYGLIYLSPDLDKITKESHNQGYLNNRYIVRSVECLEVKKFLKVPYNIKEGFLHTLVAEIKQSSEDVLEIAVFGHEEYDILKKLSIAFISKYPDCHINLKLETTTSDYVYDQVTNINFWQILKRIFFTIHFKLNEPTTHSQ